MQKKPGSSFRRCVAKMLLVSSVELLVFKILLPLSCDLENDILSLSITEIFWIGTREIARTSIESCRDRIDEQFSNLLTRGKREFKIV